MSDLGAQLFTADLGRILRGRENNNNNNNNNNNGDIDENDAANNAIVDDESTASTGAVALERQYFSLARDMNEVLVSPLHDAAARDNLEALRTALQDAKEHGVNTRDNAGNTPAHWAAGAGACACLKYLLELEADVTLKNSLGDTPLHRAVWRGQVDAVQMLVNFGRIDVAIRNNDHMLAVDLARDARIRSILAGLAPLDSVPEVMRAFDEDFENSDDDDDDDDDDEEEEVDEIEQAKRDGFVFDGRHDDNDNDDDDSDADGDDGDVDAFIVVGDTGDRVQIVHVGVREAVVAPGPPPPVPPRHNRPPLSQQPTPAAAAAAAITDDDLPPLESFDQPSKFDDAD
jgi:hypothetical protein